MSFLLLALLALPAACATGRTGPAADAVVIGDVPFFTQEAYQCGPTALATVMDYWYRKEGSGRWVTPESIAREIYSPSARGVLNLDLEILRETRLQGGAVRGRHRRPQETRRSGSPPIVFVDYGLLGFEANHFMVVTGYTRDGVLVNSGRRENQRLSDGALVKIWRRNGYWTLALRPSD